MLACQSSLFVTKLIASLASPCSKPDEEIAEKQPPSSPSEYFLSPCLACSPVARKTRKHSLTCSTSICRVRCPFRPAASVSAHDKTSVFELSPLAALNFPLASFLSALATFSKTFPQRCMCFPGIVPGGLEIARGTSERVKRRGTHYYANIEGPINHPLQKCETVLLLV